MLPKVGGQPAATAETARTWAVKGVKGTKLESILIGGKRFTSQRAVREFLAALNNAQ